MPKKKKIVIGLGILLGILMVLSWLFGEEAIPAISASDNAARLPSGGNLIKSNILSDPSVTDLSLQKIQSCAAAFPANWDYAEGGGVLPHGNLEMRFTTYSQNELVISDAESSDGLVWSGVDEGVLKPSGWDKIGVETADVLKGPDGTYRMYYSSSLKENDDFAIGLALSSDGKNWTKYADKPIFTAANAWEQGANSGVTEPSVLYDREEKIYKMWYSALGEKDGESAFRIGYATSDDGINWKRRPEPVLDTGKQGDWDDILASHVNVVKTQEGYHMFYFGVQEWCEDCGMQKGALGHAFSKDGVHWEKDPNNPIIGPREGRWDAWTAGGPSAIVEDGRIWLWYFGNHSKDSFEGRIGLVSASCDLN